MRILAKIGGAALEESGPRSELAASVAAAVRDGHEVILVHGGGNQIRSLTGRLGIPDRYVDGLRVTDAATAEAVLCVLGGSVNRTLVAALGDAGLSAVGITGADGASFDARKLERGDTDLGYVGAVQHVRPALVDTLLGAGHVPVIATVAPLAPDAEASTAGAREHLYNINADHAAGPLAHALGADALLLLTDVPGVLEDEKLLPLIDPHLASELRERGVLQGGMLPKVEAALGCAAAAPEAQVKIAPGSGPDALRAALLPETGTLLRGTDRARA